VNFITFTFIYEGFRVLSAAFLQILLFAKLLLHVTLQHLIVGMYSLRYLFTSTTLGQPTCFLIILQ